MNTHKHTNITCKLRADVDDIYLKRTALLIYVVFILLLKNAGLHFFFFLSYSVTYTRNLNKSGKTALLCRFISSITVVAQYTIYYKKLIRFKEKENVNRF